MTPSTIAEAFIERARKSPDDLALVLISESGQENSFSVGELYSRAEHIASSLLRQGIGIDDIVILVLPHSFDLLAGFWGIQLLGAVSTVFNYKSPFINEASYFEKVAAMASQAGAKAILTIPEYRKALGDMLKDEECVIISTDESTGEDPKIILPDHASSTPENGAILQYSSGTQGLRKGVMLSQQVILKYLEIAKEANELNTNDVVISWLPLYHDMGLIACFITPIVRGILTVLISPFYWIQNPTVLFKAIDKYKGTLAYMPNFAFNHCVKLISDQDLDGLDLSHMRELVNGAEPVDIKSMNAFHEKFAPYGFKESALAVGYGLAENVLGISRTPAGELPSVDWVNRRELREKLRAVPISEKAKEAKPIMSCGYPMIGVEVQILDDENNQLPDRDIGEIIIRSNTLFSGYHQQAELTKQAFKEGWFFTGDLGYMTDGQLYVTGRKKDLIIVAGDNIYPRDVEDIANLVEGIRPGRCVAFGLKNEDMGTERIVLVAELKNPLSEDEKEMMVQELRRNVSGQVGVNLSEVHLTDDRGWVVKTASGKISRPANKEKYVNLFGADG